jgi:short-subunit dehydrogenase
MNRRNALLLTLFGIGAWLWQRNQQRANATSLANKVVIVTGASSGIGKAIAEAFAAEGAHLVLVARRANILAELQQRLQTGNRRILTIPADLLQEEEIERVVEETLAEFGRIDVLVNSAGLTMGGYFVDQDPAAMRRMIELNLTATLHLTQQVIPVMQRQHSGHIVNISSVAGVIHSPGQASYAATKSGLNAFSEGLRRELKPDSVRVSIIMPGWTDTPMINPVHLKKFPGFREGLIRLQSAEFVAKHTLDAVRYNLSHVRLGGIGFGIMEASERFSHQYVDFWLSHIFNQEAMIDAIHQTETDSRSTARTGEPQA